MTCYVEWMLTKDLEIEFTTIVKRLDLDDWRVIQTDEYLALGTIPKRGHMLDEKLKRLRYYEKHGKPFINDLNLDIPSEPSKDFSSSEKNDAFTNAKKEFE